MSDLCHMSAADIRHDMCSFRSQGRMLQYGSCYMCSILYSIAHMFHWGKLYTNEYNIASILKKYWLKLGKETTMTQGEYALIEFKSVSL